MYQKADKPVDVHNFVDNKVDIHKFRGSYFDRCVLWYRMDEMTGTTTKDWSFNGNTGTIYGATWTAAGKFHHCLSFDGNNDYVGSKNNITPKSAITVIGWMKLRTSSPYYKRLLETRYDTGVYLGTGNDSALVTTKPFCFIIANTFLEPTLPVALDKTKWHLWAGTWNGSIMKGYIDGVVVGSQAKSGVLTPNVLGIAKDMAGTAGYTDGYIDEVQIYSRVLSADEIRKRYEIGRCPPT